MPCSKSDVRFHGTWMNMSYPQARPGLKVVNLSTYWSFSRLTLPRLVGVIICWLRAVDFLMFVMEVRENGSLMTLKAHFLPIKSITSCLLLVSDGVLWSFPPKKRCALNFTPPSNGSLKVSNPWWRWYLGRRKRYPQSVQRETCKKKTAGLVECDQ